MSAIILIVEDHDLLRRALRDWLSVELPDSRLITAASGEEAVAITLHETPQIVIMDIALPSISGIEATRQIKEASPDTQVVILTFHDAAAYQSDAKVAGASAFIAKRYMQTELISVLKVLLAECRNSAN